MKFKIALMILIVLFSFNTVSGYEFFSVLQDDGTAVFNATPPSFFWNGTCTAEIELLATASHTSAFSFSNGYFMPTNNRISTGNPTYPSNIVCRAQGNATGSLSLNDFYTPRTSTTSSATTTATWARTYYNCLPDADNLIIYSETNTPDQEGHYPYGYVRATGGWCVNPAGAFPAVATQLSTLTSYLGNGYFTECGNDLFQMEVDQQQVSCAGNKAFGQSFWGVVPFNSGSAGLVNISVTDQDFFSSGANWVGLTCTTNKIYLWDTVTNGTTQIGNAVPFFKDNVLIPDRDYFLFMGSECTAVSGAGASLLGFNSSIYNIRIFAPPTAFVCSDFSECVDGTQFRNCTDTLGNAPDRIEFQLCIEPLEIENATFGFEDFFTDFGLVCVPDYDAYRAALQVVGFDVTACDYLPVPQNKTRKIPVNWTTSETALTVPRDYITMTDEWSSEGFLSLKMWYIPPSLGEPSSPTSCFNGTAVGFNPEIRNANFTDIIIERNITFPATNMALAFDIRACHNITEKHGGVNEPFFLNPFGGNVSFCQNECYGDCRLPPWFQATNFEVQLVDPAIGLVLDYFGTAEWHETTKFVDLIPANLSPNVNYSLRVLINNDNIFSQIPQCFLMDNIRYSVLQSSLECSKGCGGDNDITLFEPQQTTGGICVLTETPNSVDCLEETEDIEAFEACERICLKNGVELIPTDDCIPGFAPEYDDLEDSPRCAEVAIDISAEVNATSPVSSMEEGIEMFLFLVSPLFIYFYLMIILGIISTAATKHWQIGGVSMVILLFIGSLPTIAIVPLWISITVMFIIGLLIASEMRKAGTGG